MKIIDRTGDVYGRVVILHFVSRGKNGALWLGKCLCGNEKVFNIASLRSGAVRSCGCLSLERKHSGSNQMVHGDSRVGMVARLHSIWRGMLKRCNAPRSSTYSGYGGRGIRVCDEWLDYVVFKKWALESGYMDDLSIDRIDNDGNYCPSNCRWVDMKLQARNRRTTRWIYFQGEKKSLAEWCEKTGLGPGTITKRLKRGWPIEKTLTVEPYKLHTKERLIHFNGEAKNLSEWARRIGMNPQTLAYRLNKWGDPGKAITKPKLSIPG